MCDEVYLIWDVSGEGEILAVADNDHDVLRFILAHNDLYPWREDVNQDAHALWRDLLNAKVGIEEMENYFEGITVERWRPNFDYTDEKGRAINAVADEAGVDEFDIEEYKK